MRQSITRTVSIKAPAKRVLASISHPENLPDWLKSVLRSEHHGSSKSTHALARSIAEKNGQPLEVIVDKNSGTVDFLWSAGGAVDLAAARVIPVDGESELVLTIFEPPNACDGCSSLEERSEAVAADLIMLKALLELAQVGPGEAWN
jgi:hypothetical protein